VDGRALSRLGALRPRARRRNEEVTISRNLTNTPTERLYWIISLVIAAMHRIVDRELKSHCVDHVRAEIKKIAQFPASL
jgi:hypothetical protein